jgi:Anti-sigma factor NepR
MNKRKASRVQSYMETDLSTKSTVKLSPDVKAKIGQQLRAMYNDVVSQGVPDRFTEILRRLDEETPDQAVSSNKDEEGSNVPQ